MMYGYLNKVAAQREQKSSLSVPERNPAQTEVQNCDAISKESGDFVMAADSRHMEKMGKFHPPFKGPYMAKKMVGQNAHCLPLDGGFR